MKTISLNVKSIQKTMGEEPVVIEFITEGKLYFMNGACYIIYDESELSGLAGHKTTLKIKERQVHMSRFGPNPSKMQFEVGRRKETLYQTPYGTMRLEYLTNDIQSTLGDSEGQILIRYDLSIKELQESSHTLDIHYRRLSAENSA